MGKAIGPVGSAAFAVDAVQKTRVLGGLVLGVRTAVIVAVCCPIAISRAIAVVVVVVVVPICATVASIPLLRRRRDHFVLPGETPVVEALSQQDNVCNGVVYSQDDHGREHALQDGTQDVEDIAGEPDDDKLEG